MKEKHRYVLIKTWRKVGDTERDMFERGLYFSLLNILGEFDYSIVHPKLIKFLDKEHFIMKCSLEGKGKLIAALSLVKKLNSEDSFLYTLKSSGTLKALQKYYSAIS